MIAIRSTKGIVERLWMTGKERNGVVAAGSPILVGRFGLRVSRLRCEERGRKRGRGSIEGY
jgi:hypothetical protein